MSNIDMIIEDLKEQIDKDKGEIDIQEVEKQEDKIKEGDAYQEASKSDKKKTRAQIKKLKEMAEDTPKEGGPNRQPGTRKKGGAKANPQPPNVNPDGVRCYIRYNNMGIPYRTCNDAEGRKPRKPKSQITPQLTPEEFADQHGGYSNLSEGQTRTYHRLYMREKRLEEQKAMKGGEKYIKQFREEKKRQRKKDAKLKLKIRQEKKKAKKAIQQEKEETGFAIPLSLRKEKILPNTIKILKIAKDSQNEDMRQNQLSGLGINMRNDIKKMSEKDFNAFINSDAVDDLKKILSKKTTVFDNIKGYIKAKKDSFKKD